MPKPARQRLDGTVRKPLSVPFHLTVQQLALALSLHDEFNPRPERPLAYPDVLRMIRLVLRDDSAAVAADYHHVIRVESGVMPDPYRPPVALELQAFANDFAVRRRRYRLALKTITDFGELFLP